MNIERQERNILAAYPSAHIIKEAFTGTKIEGRKEIKVENITEFIYHMIKIIYLLKYMYIIYLLLFHF